MQTNGMTKWILNPKHSNPQTKLQIEMNELYKPRMKWMTWSGNSQRNGFYQFVVSSRKCISSIQNWEVQELIKTQWAKIGNNGISTKIHYLDCFSCVGVWCQTHFDGSNNTTTECYKFKSVRKTTTPEWTTINWRKRKNATRIMYSGKHLNVEWDLSIFIAIKSKVYQFCLLDDENEFGISKIHVKLMCVLYICLKAHSHGKTHNEQWTPFQCLTRLSRSIYFNYSISLRGRMHYLWGGSGMFVASLHLSNVKLNKHHSYHNS